MDIKENSQPQVAEKKMNYIEFPAADLQLAERFYSAVFAWRFTDYGPDYKAFTDGHMDGGFYQADKASNADDGAALLVFYTQHLEQLRDAVVQAGGIIKLDIFSFPGGRRFQFLDPNGNELAVWSDS